MLNTHMHQIDVDMGLGAKAQLVPVICLYSIDMIEWLLYIGTRLAGSYIQCLTSLLTTNIK